MVKIHFFLSVIIETDRDTRVSMGFVKSVIRFAIVYTLVEILLKHKEKSTVLRLFFKYVANNKYILIIIGMILLEVIM